MTISNFPSQFSTVAALPFPLLPLACLDRIQRAAWRVFARAREREERLRSLFSLSLGEYSQVVPVARVYEHKQYSSCFLMTDNHVGRVSVNSQGTLLHNLMSVSEECVLSGVYERISDMFYFAWTTWRGFGGTLTARSAGADMAPRMLHSTRIFFVKGV
jgi:hypothetical protein